MATEPAKKPRTRRASTPKADSGSDTAAANDTQTAAEKKDDAAGTKPAAARKSSGGRRTTAGKAAPKSGTAKTGTSRTGGAKSAGSRKSAAKKDSNGWGTTAAIAGGVAAVGAVAAAAFVALKPAKKDDAVPGGKAHQADGTDSSASFQAGIADEGTIPEKI